MTVLAISLLAVLLWREKYHTQKIGYYEALINEIPFNLVLFDNKWRFQIINKYAMPNPEKRRWMLGKAEMDYWKYFKNDPEKGRACKELLNNALETRQSQSMEETAIDKNGNKKYFLRTFTPLFSAIGKHLGFVGFRYELTEKKQQEEEIEMLRNKLKHSKENMANISDVVSHELKTVTKDIISTLHLFERKNKKNFDDTDKEYLQSALSEAKQINTFINSLHFYCSIDRQKHEAQLVNLNYVLQVVKFNLNSSRIDHYVHISIGLLPSIVAHDYLLLQLFQNLIANGIKYNKNQLPSIYVFTKTVDNQLIYGVCDNGIGISYEYKETIFKLFERIDISNEYTGSGVGLATCKRIVELYGGKIWFESVEGIGTTFYFTLPCTTVHESMEAFKLIN